MQDCRAHKIDLILVKSVSRFARNTQDCIEAVRELRQLGVTVIFEKEHLNTGTMANEMLLSMMSAFSQEESVSISKNMHKGAAMRMQNGTYKTSTPAYGYRNDESGKLVIVPEEAEVVRYIFERFLSGDGIESIQKKLHEKYRTNDIQRIFSPTGILYSACPFALIFAVSLLFLFAEKIGICSVGIKYFLLVRVFFSSDSNFVLC